MGELMPFPDTVEEFMEEYKIVDTKEVYSNGIEMVPIFRMIQWFEHERAKEKTEKRNAKHFRHIKNALNQYDDVLRSLRDDMNAPYADRKLYARTFELEFARAIIADFDSSFVNKLGHLLITMTKEGEE